VPVDISRQQLNAVARSMAADYPHLQILPICADFTSGFGLPGLQQRPRRWFTYFPGSTIGNFDSAEAAAFLGRLRTIVGPGGGLLIGVDLKKDPAVLHAAYNDAAGVTAEFNRNILHRINRDLHGTFVPDLFAHYAFYNLEHSRIEMHLVSRKRQVASAADRQFEFKSGESIFTESSYKHDPYEFAQLAESAGFELRRMWTDERKWFSVQLYVAK
jgi:dimethylhistidine N-methyltransferase